MTDKEIFAEAFLEAAVWADAPEDYEGEGLASDCEVALREFAGTFFDSPAITGETKEQTPC